MESYFPMVELSDVLLRKLQTFVETALFVKNNNNNNKTRPHKPSVKMMTLWTGAKIKVECDQDGPGQHQAGTC